MIFTGNLTEDPDAALQTLTTADWSAFTPERDLPPLRAALATLERTHGITDAHHHATERIRAYGALLRHPDAHLGRVLAHALSPCGRYLAVGSTAGDFPFDEIGVLQIWEVATGRCVNVIEGVPSGVGPDIDRHMIQWSADASRIAVVHHTFMVGIWEPFGDPGDWEGEPIVEVHVSDSRPHFALAPDGRRLVMWGGWDEEDRRGRIFSLDDGEEPGALLSVETLSDEILAREPLTLDWSTWSEDGERVYGYSLEGWACSIDVASGRIAWLTDTDDPLPSWSPDEKYVAYHQDDSLVIADALTGRRLATHAAHPDATLLAWGPGGRLAVVTPADGSPETDAPTGTKGSHSAVSPQKAHPNVRDLGARPGVSIVSADDRLDDDLALALRPTGWMTPDLFSWAWSPTGDRAACLTGDGPVEIWHLGEHPERRRVIDVPEDASGLLWGADDTLVIVTSDGDDVEDSEVIQGLRFVRAETGETVGAFQFRRTPSGPKPLHEDGDDLDLEISPNPVFALDEDTWAIAFEPGLVIAPPGREADLDTQLTWSVDRRYAWPTRWGTLEIFPNVTDAADHATPPLNDLAEPFRDDEPAA
ncbi:hypothetical protein [Nonomuraea longicatena]|uniref:WD40 repeat domain-containing protein n=1 Tax=Nonomuraea longicatena TaxID=83682 RepID=A0ABN1PDZ2_9ACTN